MRTIIQAQFNDTVKTNFTCKLEDGTIFDTTDGKEPLQFTLGEKQVVSGLEQAIIGMKEGEFKTVKIPADKAFGLRQADLVKTINRSEFPANIEPQKGMKFNITHNDGTDNAVLVADVTESHVTLDANHPLAGKDLYFEIHLIEIVQSDINKAEALYTRGVAFQDRDLLDEAIDCYQEAIKFNQYHFKSFYNLGVAFHQKGQLDRAMFFYKIVLNFEPNNTEALHNLGNIFKEKGDHDEAITYFQMAIAANPDFVNAYNSMGASLQKKGLFDQAINQYKKALQIDSEFVDAYSNLGTAYQEQGQLVEAISYYQKALNIDPNHVASHLNMAVALLLSGNLEDGWKEYEWRWKTEYLSGRTFDKPRWNGSDIREQTLLLHAEQGYGNTIQFIRYAPLVAQQNKVEVIVECPKQLLPLLKGVQGVKKVIEHGEQLPAFDVQCPLLSLPFIFNTTIKSIPHDVPYISVAPDFVQKWKIKFPEKKSDAKIGLVWAESSDYKADSSRSLTLNHFSSLANLGNITLYSLQMGTASEQTKLPPKGMYLIDYTPEIDNFSDTAALIENLDLVITADTAVAHLAGALGKTVWTLLPYVPDWRWMLDREDSPWYPTMRLFRQPSYSDWDSVIENVAKELGEFIKSLV